MWLGVDANGFVVVSKRWQGNATTSQSAIRGRRSSITGEYEHVLDGTERRWDCAETKMRCVRRGGLWWVGVVEFKSSFLDVFIKWNEQDKELIIENARITSADRTRNELFGKYTIAKFKEQKNRAFLDEEDFDDNLVSSADQGWWIKRRDSKSKPKLLNSYSINWHLLQAFSFSINCSFKLFNVYMRIMVFSFVVIDFAHKSITLLYV